MVTFSSFSDREARKPLAAEAGAGWAEPKIAITDTSLLWAEGEAEQEGKKTKQKHILIWLSLQISY